MVRAQVERRGGHVVKSQGDGFMAVFGDRPPTRCDAAIAIQRQGALGGAAARRTPLRVRIGLNCGPVVSRHGDYFGTNVAKAARIAALAEGDQILVAQEVAEVLVAARTPDGSTQRAGRASRSSRCGSYELRGLAGQHEIYTVHA